MEQDNHHLFYPRREYRSPVEKRIRNTGAFIIKMDILEHRALHANVEPPMRLHANEYHDLYQFMQDHTYELGTLEGVEWAMVWARDKHIHEFADNLEQQYEYIERGTNGII